MENLIEEMVANGYRLVKTTNNEIVFTRSNQVK